MFENLESKENKDKNLSFIEKVTIKGIGNTMILFIKKVMKAKTYREFLISGITSEEWIKEFG